MVHFFSLFLQSLHAPGPDTKIDVTLENNHGLDKKLKRDISTHERISKSPLHPDEWERSRVEVRRSLIETVDGLDAGEGLLHVRVFV